MSGSFSSDSRRNSDTIVRFRNLGETLSWSAVDSLECDLNAVVHRGRLSEDEDGRVREGSSGKFTGIFGSLKNLFTNNFSLLAKMQKNGLVLKKGLEIRIFCLD